MTTSPRYLVCEEDLETLTNEWNALLPECANTNVFLRPSWLQLWRHVFDGPEQLRIMTVREGERLIGVAAFLVDGDRLRIAGDPEVWDYAGLPIREGCEREVVQALLTWIASEGWNRLDFWGLDAESPTLRELEALAPLHGFEVRREQEAVCPRIELPGTWEAYLESLNKKDRHELRRKMRRFTESEGEAQLVVLSGPDEVEAALPDFFRLHIQSREDKAEFMTPAMQHFFRHVAGEMAREGLLRLYFLERRNERLASVFCFDGGSSLLMYNSGYDPAYAGVSVGLVSKAMLVQQAIEEGKERVDFLRGPERYKYDLGARDAAVYRCSLVRA